MDKFDKLRYQQHLKMLEREGQPAIWIGSERFCSPYPVLRAGMTGIYVPERSALWVDPERRCLNPRNNLYLSQGWQSGGYFYPDPWKRKYAIAALGFCQPIPPDT